MSTRNLTILGIVVLVIVALLMLNNSHEQKKSNIERAAEDISDGIKNAGGEFKDKGPIEKVGDAVKDAGQNIKESTDRD